MKKWSKKQDKNCMEFIRNRNIFECHFPAYNVVQLKINDIDQSMMLGWYESYLTAEGIWEGDQFRKYLYKGSRGMRKPLYFLNSKESHWYKVVHQKKYPFPRIVNYVHRTIKRRMIWRLCHAPNSESLSNLIPPEYIRESFDLILLLFYFHYIAVSLYFNSTNHPLLFQKERHGATIGRFT